MKKKIFVFSFIIVCILQSFIFIKFDGVDFNMWADQAKYVQTNNPIQFDYRQAYGHPGGPIIEGTIFLHSLFDLSYKNSLLIFLIFIDAIIVSSISILCFSLSKNNLWWPITLATLSASWLYIFSSPPSIIASLLICLLALFSIYLYKEKEIQTKHLTLFGLLIGFMIATRTDIGGIFGLTFLIFLKSKISWRQFYFILFCIAISFILLDPFMWFIPIEHLGDLVFKIVYHYEYFSEPSKVSIPHILSISSFAVMSILFSGLFLIKRKNFESDIPKRFILSAIIATVVLCSIFLTSIFQSPRYFLPLILLWETLLPAFVFPFIEQLPQTNREIIKKVFAVIMILAPFISLAFYI